MDSFSTEESHLDSEIQSLRQSCKALERDCQKRHGSLEKKQARWELTLSFGKCSRQTSWEIRRRNVPTGSVVSCSTSR